MDIDAIATLISEKLPWFEYRIMIIASIVLLVISLWILSAIKVKNRKKLSIFKMGKTKITIFIINIICILSAIATFLITAKYKILDIYECSIVGVSILGLFTATNTINLIYLKPNNSATDSTETIVRHKIIPKCIPIVFSVIGGLVIALLVTVTLFARPYLVSTTPWWFSTMKSTDEKIEVRLDIPVKVSKTTIKISPDQQGTWECSQRILGSDYCIKFRYNYDSTFWPDTKVVVYASGLTRILNNGPVHEQAWEFHTPKTANIVSIFPALDADNIPISKPIIINFDNSVGDFLEWKLVSQPEVPYEILYPEDNVMMINFTQPLEQDRDYNFDLYRNSRTYKISDKTTKELGETVQLPSIRFRTVRTPGIDSYEPQGDMVRAESIIKVTFKEDMNLSDVERKFSITPETQGTISWESDRIFVFTPQNPLNKDTEYSINFGKGLLSKFGGETKDPINLKFRTIGKVTVIGTYPISGYYGIEPTSTNLVITFNQEVDHESAQQHFSMSPDVGGWFSWDGNSMIYNVSGKLGYSTQYNYSVSPGVKTIYGLDSDQQYNGYFTTRDYVFLLGVPYYGQAGTFNCNVAAAQMALSYRGIYVDQESIKAGIGYGSNPDYNWVESYGTNIGPLNGYINNYRGTGVFYGTDLGRVLDEVSNGNPVVFWRYNGLTRNYGWDGNFFRGQHSGVVVGYVGPKSYPYQVIIHDPWYGANIYMDTGTFVGYWSYIGWAVAVY